MYKFFVTLFVILFSLYAYSIPISSAASFSQTKEIREDCRNAQDIEKKISNFSLELNEIDQEERKTAPLVRNIYDIITRCFTVLIDIQRFSKFLAISYHENKNDFVRCSIIIKNFAGYFKSISAELGKASKSVANMQKKRNTLSTSITKLINEHEELCARINMRADKIAKTRIENAILNDIVYHLSTKSESLEELDAELEAENAVGVLKSEKFSKELLIAYPVFGKIVSEFGDKGNMNQMIYYMGFQSRAGAIVTSPTNGIVVFSGKFLNYGNLLIISNGDYRLFLYGVDYVFVKTGDKILIGDYVGKMKEKNFDMPIIKMELKRSGEPLDPRHWLLSTLEKEKNK